MHKVETFLVLIHKKVTIMKKKFFFATVAIVALASCADQEYIGESPSPSPNNGTSPEKTIVFGSGTKALTRADRTGKEAADLLNKNFVFAGTKSDGTIGTDYVFDQYVSQWKENTANTTESNSNDWEYVGYTPASTSAIATTQTIKYWDYSKSQYDFAAYSLGTGSATASKINFSTMGTQAYTLTGSVADLKACYISDLVTAYNKTDGSDVADDFGKVVQFSFRSLATKIRLAFYETIPGYSVKNIQFYPSAATDATASGTPTLFTASGVLPSGSGTMTVKFETTGWGNRSETDYNKAHVTFAQASGVDAATTMTFDALADFATAEFNETASESPAVGWIGRASNAATYAGGLEYGTGKYYNILPLEAGAPLQLRIKYTLVSTDGSGESINVDNATAVIPAEFAKWNPNYAYTYIFKLSDLTNGYTGFGPDGSTPVNGLTPITLNAVVVDSEDGLQETITTVNKPSITTYMLGKVVTENDEYIVNGTHPIYIVVNNGTSNETLITDGNGSTRWTNAKLYTVALDDAEATASTTALNPKSEEAVDNALKYGTISGSTYTVKDANGWKLVVTDVTSSKLTGEVTTMPATDSPNGNVIGTSANPFNCATFVPESGKTYVFQYITNPSAIVAPTYAVIPYVTKLTAGETYYTYDGSSYTSFTATGHEVVCKVLYTKSGDVYTRVTGTTLTTGTMYYLSKFDTVGFAAAADDTFGGTYYTKDASDNYHPVGYLEAGETYYTSARGAGKFVAAGSEVITTDAYWTCTNAASVVDGVYKYKIIKVQ